MPGHEASSAVLAASRTGSMYLIEETL